MKKTASYLLFALGTAAILAAAAASICFLRQRPLIASLAGTVLLAAAVLVLLRRHLLPLLCPRRTAERQLAALLQQSPQATLLYYDTPAEDAGPVLVLTVRLEHRIGLTAFRLSLPAGHPDLPGLLSLPADAELTAVFPISPAKSLQFDGTVSPLPNDSGGCTLLFTPRTLRLPCRACPVSLP